MACRAAVLTDMGGVELEDSLLIGRDNLMLLAYATFIADLCR